MNRVAVIIQFLCIICLLLPCFTMAQDEQTEKVVYYIGINPIAPCTDIRNEFSSLYLPIIANHEAGAAISVGQILNRNYNFETRVSFGSPRSSYTLLQIQSGLNYCFNT